MSFVGSPRALQTDSSDYSESSFFSNFFGYSNRNHSGVTVNANTAERVSAVFSAVRLLSETIAALPFLSYRRIQKGGKVRDRQFPLFKILRTSPNRYQTAFEFWEMAMRSLLLRGNFYAQIVSTNSQAVTELIPLETDRVTVMTAPDGKIVYRYSNSCGGSNALLTDSESRIFLNDEILHLRGHSENGIIGRSVIHNAAESLGLSLAAEIYGATYFNNDATPAGVLEMDGKFKDQEARARFKEEWQAAQGGENKYRTAVLENGLKFNSIGISNKDSQFLELRAFQVTDIARIFRVPPHMIADLSKSSFNNIEQENLNLVTYSLLPWITRIEQATTRDLYSEMQKETHFSSFLLNSLMRGDSKARAEFYGKQFQTGAMSQNDIRRAEDMNVIPNGDVYYVPLNMRDSKSDMETKNA